MSNCQNCYNGCTETISDQCIKYTGIDVPSLGIETGDSLSRIEQSLITFLVSTLNGTGIKIDISDLDICIIVNKYLPICGDITIVDISRALIQAACDIQDEVSIIEEELSVLNADYAIGCLDGVISSSDTHAIVQATITKVCEVANNLDILAVNIDTNYVRTGTELNDLIQYYLDVTSGITTNYYNRMVPYVVETYYGSLTGKFDITGAGYGLWQKIYVCNGVAGTPVLTPGLGYYYIQYRP